MSATGARTARLPLTSNNTLDDVPASVEEEEFADDESLDNHDRASCNNSQQADDIEHSDDIKDDISWSSQRSSEAAHGCSRTVDCEEVAGEMFDVELPKRVGNRSQGEELDRNY